MPAGVTWTAPRGGFFTWLTRARASTPSQLSPRGRPRRDVAFVPGLPLLRRARREHDCLRLSFSRVSLPDIDAGIARLAEVAVRRRPHVHRSPHPEENTA